NATYNAPPKQPWDHVWPQWTGNAWKRVDDHRERKEPLFAAAVVQDATDYWLPGDTNASPARQMKEIGPLPKKAVTKRPAKTDAELLAEAQADKRGEVQAGYDAAVAASLTMPTASPTEQDIIIGAAAFAAEDAEGLAYVMQAHAARRTELLAAVEAAETAGDVLGVVVSYAV
ncbi:MAG: phage tail protein, partial [Desulfovibrio sp.]|nr:phage tail protein [Desulfovibrio sp.]